MDILRLSQVDFDFLYPDEALDQVVEYWFKLGISLCLVTLGSQGAVGYTAKGETAVAMPPPITVADTVSAGDTFLVAAFAFLY